MAEYKLSYTAQEIDSKLGKISEIENSLYDKQDKLTFDLEPVEDGENPITSGGVYAALQSVAGNVESVNGKMGAVELTAEDVGALPNTTQIPTVPMNVSEFSNDAGYITAEALENKQDKLTFDAEPAEGSENPVTSGGVYTAIQNATPNLTFDEVPTEGSENLVKSGAIHAALQNVGGGTDLVAGDLIEIKDGVIRSTLGDFIGTETENAFVEFYHADNIEMYDQENGTYGGEIGVDLVNAIDIDTNENLTIKFELSDGTIKTFDVDATYEYNEDEGITYIFGLYNYVESDDGFVKVDENSDALYLEGGINEEMLGFGFVTSEDYTGASITISQGGLIERDVYVTLPENALIAGNLIKIENGVVSSLLGERVVSKKEVELCNIESIPSDNYEEGGQTSYSGECSCVPMKGDKLNVEITLANSDAPIIFNDVEVKVGEEGIYIFANSNQTIEDIDNNGVAKIDESLPFVAVLFMEDEDEGACYYDMISFEDITGASIKVGGTITEVEVTKLPNKALTFDSEPTEGSRNLVNSDGVYAAINNVKSSFVYDGTPTQYSQNLMKSGDIYDAFVASENKVSTTIDNYMEEKCVGRNYIDAGGDKGEIFNDYLNNLAFEYSHAEGSYTKANARCSHAEGGNTTARGHYSHAEGSYTKAIGDSSHAEGRNTTASGKYSHAEGEGTTASGDASHAEGDGTKATAIYSHAEGCGTEASGDYSHAEGWFAKATAIYSHAEGRHTFASGDAQHVQGKYNIEDASGTYAHIVGNGGSTGARSNAHTLDWDGNAWYAGTVEATAIILKSSTEGSTKRFKVTVDDNGTLSATEIA